MHGSVHSGADMGLLGAMRVPRGRGRQGCGFGSSGASVRGRISGCRLKPAPDRIDHNGPGNEGAYRGGERQLSGTADVQRVASIVLVMITELPGTDLQHKRKRRPSEGRRFVNHHCEKNAQYAQKKAVTIGFNLSGNCQ